MSDLIKIKCILCGKVFEAEDKDEARICENCWKCPHCGAGIESDKTESGEGFIDDSYGNVTCEVCNWSWSYRELEKALLKKKDIIECPCCKGRGYMKSKKAVEIKKKLK